MTAVNNVLRLNREASKDLAKSELEIRADCMGAVARDAAGNSRDGDEAILLEATATGSVSDEQIRSWQQICARYVALCQVCKGQAEREARAKQLRADFIQYRDEHWAELQRKAAAATEAERAALKGMSAPRDKRTIDREHPELAAAIAEASRA